MDAKKRQEAALKAAINHKLCYIGETISPSPASETTLESIENALKYYRERGVTHVVVQRKYMGSRCQIYLTLDDEQQPVVEKCFAISRNGFVIPKRICDFKEIFQQCAEYAKKLSKDLRYIVFDGELLPWSLMGRGLIKYQYERFSQQLRAEEALLKDTGFKTKIESLTYENVQKNMKEHHFNKFKESLGFSESDLNAFDEQLVIYGSDTETVYKPFNIIESDAGVFDDFDLMKSVFNEDWKTLNLADDMAYLVNSLKEFSDDPKLEGVVIKVKATLDDLEQKPVHSMKVRNPEYLRIIYGYDYLQPEKYAKLVATKHISYKVKLSCREHEVNKLLKSIPREARTADNAEYVSLLAKMMGIIAKEQEVDERL
jgi:hypothetical protein